MIALFCGLSSVLLAVHVRVEALQIVGQVDAVLAHQLPVQPYLAAAVLGPVALDQIPVNRGAVLIVPAGEVVAGAQGHVHGAEHLLVKEGLPTGRVT